MLSQSQTLIMAVINLTPDSFSDGGECFDTEKAVQKAWEFADQGADIVDLGAESTRPGASSVTTDREWTRLEPVLCKLKSQSFPLPISIDTRRQENMIRALDYSVAIINDVHGGTGTDDSTLQILADNQITYLAMHMEGQPQSMQENPLAPRVAVENLKKFYKTTHQRLRDHGFDWNQIWLDPGIGFGKSDAANLQLLKQVSPFSQKYNLAVGVSRKSFIGRCLEIEKPKQRDKATKMLELYLLFSKIKAIRTHEVATLNKLRKLVEAN